MSVSSFIGGGASRFMLTYAPEQPNAAYGQLIIRTSHRDHLPPTQKIRDELPAQFPNAEIYTQQLMFGPGSGAKLLALPVLMKQYTATIGTASG
ncbi:hypothetical protein [Alishewanella longhuensis]